MALPPLHPASAPFLAWIGGLCAALILLLGDLLPFRLPWTRPEDFFLCVVRAELFLALLVWPLFVPGILRRETRPPQLLIHVALLLVFALPLVLIGANVSAAGALDVIRSQALVAAAAALGAGVASLPRRAALTLYLLAVFLASALLPFWAFLGEELRSPTPAFASAFSLFWGAGQAGAAAWVQAGVCGAAGAAMLALGNRTPA